MASSVSLKNGTHYLANVPIIPLWTGKWKVNRDKSIIFKNNIHCNWITQEGWYYLQI
jgi:hypothetical protein